MAEAAASTTKPSRTYNLALFGMGAQLVLSLLVLLLGWLQPEALDSASAVFVIVAGGIAASSAGGAGAMSYRDAASGGKTTSQAHPGMFGPPEEGSGLGQ